MVLIHSTMYETTLTNCNERPVLGQMVTVAILHAYIYSASV